MDGKAPLWRPAGLRCKSLRGFSDSLRRGVLRSPQARGPPGNFVPCSLIHRRFIAVYKVKDEKAKRRGERSPSPPLKKGERKVHKTVTVMALAALFTLVAAGVAVALTKTCTSVPCEGTAAADVLKERVGDGKRDVIYGFQGNDRLRANRYTNDTDDLYGGRGNDRVHVLDGDFRDWAVGGPGNDDFCLVDDEAELSPTCEGFAIP
jgi:hypothetical protein